jgi:hypothetical protein
MTTQPLLSESDCTLLDLRTEPLQDVCAAHPHRVEQRLIAGYVLPLRSLRARNSWKLALKVRLSGWLLSSRVATPES